MNPPALPAALPRLTELFAADPDRVQHLSIDVGGIRFDLSKTHVDKALIADGEEALGRTDLTGRRKALFSGEIVNPTEQRAAEHTAERGFGSADAVERARANQARMRALVEVIEAGAFGPVRHLLHIGIGGSALGPKMLIDALARDNAEVEVHVVSNVDGAALAEAFGHCEPATTLIAVASKTFTTTETLINAASALAWLRESGVADPEGRVIALTANPAAAIAWGVDETRVLPFAETVGGRYSMWCSIGFPVALALGWAGYAALLEGAAVMDRHFLEAPVAENVCILAALADRFYAGRQQISTRAVFAYDERLRLLPDYLQQLEMESNGKSVTAEGAALAGPSAPITWGGVGTDAQHAVFQLLHQGTHVLSVEFVAAKAPGHDLDPVHHETLLINCFAQGAALMSGRASDDAARNYPGNRPSTTILLDDVTPETLGALIAFYEHRTFVNAVLMGINPFDQFGVELGKQIANSIADDGPEGFDPSTQALIAFALEDR